MSKLIKHLVELKLEKRKKTKIKILFIIKSLKIHLIIKKNVN
jgi:hypothetical protein